MARKAWWQQHWWSGLLLGLLILGGLLRMHHYAEFPVYGETQDEVAWTMLGSSLLQTGVPQSWSYFEQYTDVRTVQKDGSEFTIVRPAVDHPPLFSFLPAVVHTLQGMSWESLPSAKTIRFPMVLLGIVNISLFAIWVNALWGKSTRTLVAVMLMSTVPSFVFLSRLVVSENLLVTWFLVSLVCLVFRKHIWAQWGLLVALVALPLTKIAGIPLGVGLIIGSLPMVPWRYTRQMMVALLVGIGALVIYMALFDLPLFLAVQFGQAGRDVGFLTGYITQFSFVTLVEKLGTDMWVWLGYITVLVSFWLAPNQKKESKEYQWWHLLLTVFLAQFAFLMLSIGEHTVHGWYRIVFLPIFAYFWGGLAKVLWEKVQWLSLSILLILLSFLPRNALRGLVSVSDFWEIQSTISRYWLVICGLPIIGLLGHHFSWPKWNWKKSWQMSLGVVFVIVLLSHILSVVTMKQETYWEDALYIESGIRS